MAKTGATKVWVTTVGVALLLAFVALPALSGAASAAPVMSTATTPASTQWAYGGQGWSNGTVQSGSATLTWNASFGWTVVFTVTPTTPGTWMLEEQRTVGITIAVSYSGSILQGTYNYHGEESDVAFANLTNQSVVYVNDQPVPALGIDNASASVSASIAEAISVTMNGHTASASLNVQGVGQAATSFSPSLGMVPLNLTGIDQWNSTATGSPSASWNVSWAWNDQGFNGTTGSGSGSRAGSLSGTGPVNLTGFKLHLGAPPVFRDGKSRTAIVLVVQGVFDNYDGFIWVPHAFNLFGSASHDYDSVSFGSAAISAETLYLDNGPGVYGLSAASSTFGSDDHSVNTLATPVAQVTPAAGPASPAGTVVGQPMTVAQANAEANCLAHGCVAKGSSGISGGLLVALVGVAVVAIVVAVGVIEWHSYARRRSSKGLVGGYGESWPNGVPPGAALSPPAMGPSEGKTTPPEDIARRP